MEAVQRALARARAPEGAVREPLVGLARVVLVAQLAVVLVSAVRRTTWYLAIDQFGYLMFARDLASGHVLHDWELLPALQKFLPPDAGFDVYAQTYVRRGDMLFCRYPPGFPLLLALVRVIFGPEAQHLVNPFMMVLVLGCLYAIGRRVLRSEWLGVACALLGALLPNYVLLWSTSALRDVPAHVFALAGIALLLPRDGPQLPWRVLLSGLLIGFAVTTRIDAILYVIPAGGLALLSSGQFRRRLAAGVVGFSIGILPLLAYNWLATGNPLRPTQAMEIDAVISRAPTGHTRGAFASVFDLSGTAVAAEVGVDGTEAPTDRTSAPTPAAGSVLVQGGGLRLSHLMATLPANLVILREALGDLGIALGGVGILAAVRYPTLLLLTVPYILVSVFFFSLWTIPGPRYLAGAMLLYPFLMLEGARFLATLPARLAQRGLRAGAIAAFIVLACVLLALVERTPFSERSALPLVLVVLAGSILLSAAAGLWAGVERAAILVCLFVGLGLSGAFAWRSLMSLDVRASFQRTQVEQARSALEGALETPAVVLTSSRIGHAAENINYYTTSDALYLEEMTRWRVQPRYVISRLLRKGYSVYLLLPPDYTRRWLANSNISSWYKSEVLRTIPAEKSAEYFVASPYHHGVPLLLVRLTLRPEADQGFAHEPESAAP